MKLYRGPMVFCEVLIVNWMAPFRRIVLSQ